MSDDRPNLGALLAELPDKTRPPHSVSVLNDWVNHADRKTKAGGRLAWLVASTVEEFLEGLDESLAPPWGPLTLRRENLVTIRTPTRVVKPRRFDVVVEMKGKTWRRIQVEISPDEGGAGSQHEAFPAPRLGSVGLPAPEEMVGLAMRFQVAQKIHACTDPHDPPHTVNDRPRDVVDLLLLRDLGVGPLTDVRAAVVAIFDARAEDARHLGLPERAWPTRITAHPHWATDYERARASAGIDLDLPTAVQAANAWLEEINAATTDPAVV